MIYLSKAEDVSKAFSELGSTAAELHSAIVKEYLVDIRLENEKSINGYCFPNTNS